MIAGAATRARPWKPVVYVLTLNSGPSFAPAASRRLGVDPGPSAILAKARPDDDRLSGRIERHIGLILGSELSRVHLELATDRVARAVVPSRHDGAELVVLRAGPGHDELAGRSHRDRRPCLITRRVLIDLELGGYRIAARVEAPREDAEAVAVLRGLLGARVRPAVPDDHEVAGGVYRDVRTRPAYRWCTC